MIIKYKLMIILFLILIQSSTLLVYSQITSFAPYPNTESTLTLSIGYVSLPITLTNITTDITNQDYFTDTHCDTANPMRCTITLNNRSQTEQYTFYYTYMDTSTTIIKATFPQIIQLSNKYYLKLSQPKPASKSILNINLLYAMPYSNGLQSYPMIVKITNLGNIKTFNSSINGSINIIDSTNFQIELDNSVGNIDVNISSTSTSNQILGSTYFEKPIISNITNDERKCTINGDNFGLSIFKGYANITLDPLISQSNLISDYINYNNTQIEFYHSYLYSNEVEFNLLVSGISIDNKLKYKFRPIIKSINSIALEGGNITINGYFLNDQRNDENKTPSNIIIMIGDKECESPSNLIKGDYTSIKCTIESPGNEFDNNLTISISIDNITNEETTIKFNYIPNIQNVQYDYINNIIKIYGPNLKNGKVFFNGEIISLIYENNSPTIPILPILEHYKNDKLYFIGENNETSNEIQIKLKPEIISITSEDNNQVIIIDGRRSKISGKFVNLKRFDGSSTSLKLINGDSQEICNVYEQYDLNTMSCVLVTLPEDMNGRTLRLDVDGEQSNGYLVIPYTQYLSSSFSSSEDVNSKYKHEKFLIIVITSVSLGTVILITFGAFIFYKYKIRALKEKTKS